jgi:hypothetical protein
MNIVQFLTLLCFIVSFLLAFVMVNQFNDMVKLMKIKRSKLLIVSGVLMFSGYILFFLPLLLNADNNFFLLEFSYLILSFGLFFMVYSLVRTYMDLKKVVR